MERQEAAEDKGKKSFWVSDMEAVLAIFIVLLVFGSINVFSSSSRRASSASFLAAA